MALLGEQAPVASDEVESLLRESRDRFQAAPTHFWTDTLYLVKEPLGF